MSDNGRTGFDDTPEGRVAFLESLIYDVEPWIDHGPIFANYLDDKDPDVRSTAIHGLWLLPDASLIDRLIEMADNDPSPEVRAKAVGGLGIYVHLGEMADYDYDFGPISALVREGELPEADFLRVKEYLLGVYGDETRTLDERRFALESLGFLSDPGVADIVEQAYQRPEKEWKISALFAMGRSGLVRWVEVLASELHNPDSEIQREAIQAAGEIGLAELGRDLLALTYADDADIMMEAVEALAKTGWPEAFDRLEELTLDEDPEIAEFAEEAMDEWLLMSEIMQDADELDQELGLDWEEDE